MLRRAIEEERGLEIHVMLQVPVLFSDVIHGGPPHEHGSHVSDSRQLTDLTCLREDHIVRRQVTQVEGTASVPGPGEAGKDVIDGRLLHVDHEEARAGFIESCAHGSPDSACRTSHHHDSPNEPFVIPPRHGSSS
jgi:hypothetical protein